MTKPSKNQRRSATMARALLPGRRFAGGILSSAIAAVLAFAVQAAEVTGEMAMAAAAAWTAENPALAQDIGSPDTVQARYGDDGRLLWYEVAMSGGGGVVVAPDTEIEPIVAVIGEYDGEIPQGHPLEAMLAADMGRRLDVLRGKVAQQNALTATGDDEVRNSATKASRKWAKLAGGIVANNATTPNTVIKYLTEWASKRLTYWNQFSTYTPNNYPAGCVATAGVALLQFFNVTHAPKVTNTCRVDGANTQLTTKGIDYNWSLLPDANANYSAFTPAQKDIADRAVYDMGVCLGMNYASGGSSASISDLANVLRTKYGFADARYVYSISAKQYDALIYNQVRAGAPVVLSIQRSGGGHAVLAVGYGEDADNTAYTRVFMGWGGSSDAWYALPNIDRYNSLSAVVTMIGATSDTMALCGRATTGSGKPAAYTDVTAGGKTALTDENGYWGVRMSPGVSTVACSCGGNTVTAAVGAQAAKVGSCSASQLAAAVPEAIDFTVPDADALIVYTSPEEAVRAALRENKILMVLVGYDGCGYCMKLKTQIKAMGSEFSSDFVLFYANTDVNAYGLNDETYTGSPYWGTFDPRVWQVERRWAADNGRFTISRGYSASGTISALDSARNQWSRLNAAPEALAIAIPDQISMPTAMSAKLSFADGTVTEVTDGLVWSVVSGSAAKILDGNVFSPAKGASGEVTLRCEGYFWNKLYTTTKTIKILDGVVAAKLEIDGPKTIDLITTDSAQFSAQAILSDGSRVEVPAEWTTVEAKSTNHVISASGCITFKKNRYSKASTITVKARYGNCTASFELAVWGESVKITKYTLSDMCMWPGKTATITIDQVQWWRHGRWEEPTSDFAGVNMYWYGYVGDEYFRGGSGSSRTITCTIPTTANTSANKVLLELDTYGSTDGADSWTAVYCQYTPYMPLQMVTVTFDGNSGEPAEQTATYATGRQYAAFPPVSRTGYYCDWSTAKEGGIYMTTSSNCTASVKRLYARWSPNYYRIVYDANGGAGSMNATWHYYDSKDTLRINTFTKAGAMFAGWATTPEGPVVYQDGAEVLNLFSDYATLTLYAVWVDKGYKVAFDANGGTGEMVPQMLSIGTCATLKPATFVRRGATFAGWALKPGGKVAYADSAEVCNLTTVCGATVTLYAVWKLPAVKTIELSGPDVIDLYDVDSAQFQAVCKLKSGAVVDVAPVWRIEETAVTNAVLLADGLITFPNPEKYHKASRLKVMVECNGVVASKEVDVWGWYVSIADFFMPQRVAWPGQTITMIPQTVTWWRHGIAEEPTDNFAGIEFKATYGWINNTTYLKPACMIAGADWPTCQIPSSMSEKAGYGYVYVKAIAKRHGIEIGRDSSASFQYLPSAPEKLVDVTFIADGGVPATQTSKYAAGYTYRYLPSITRTGYYCSWYTAKEGGKQVDTDDKVPSVNTTLYARWSPRYYYITYDANGGTGTMYNTGCYYDQPTNLRLNTFLKNGSVFAGWATSPTGPAVYADGEQVLNLASTYTVIKLYAVWSTDCYTVNFDANGGTGSMDAQNCALNACVKLGKCTFERKNHTFLGWATTPDGAVKYADGAQVCNLAKSVGAAVTLYAKWQPGFAALVYTSPWDANRVAQAEGKLLFVLSGADWCGYCTIVKNYLLQLGDAFWDKFVVYYCNIDTDKYGMANGTPTYGVFDPNKFNCNWRDGRLAYDSGGVESRVQSVINKALAAFVPTYKLTLKLGANTAKIYYKINGATSWTVTTQDTTLDVNGGSTWYAYAEGKSGYESQYPDKTQPLARVKATKAETVTFTSKAVQYKLTFKLGANIAKVYYKINGATSWTAITKDKTLNVNGGTTWYAYAEGKSGYTSYCPDPANPLARVKAAKAESVTFASKAVSTYKLTLKLGANIAKVYYKINGATSWTAITKDKTLNVNGGTTWYAYAEGKSGYTSYCPDPANPLARVKAAKAESVTFASKAVSTYKLTLKLGANIAKVYYKINGATSWTAITKDKTLNVNGGTTWYAYAEGKSGYTSYCPDPANPLARVKAAKAESVTFASKAVSTYKLTLKLGANIAKVYYKINGATSWTAITKDKTLNVNGGTTWYAYAEGKNGYVSYYPDPANPLARGKAAKAESVTFGAKTAQYKLTLKPDANIATIYYKVNGAKSWIAITKETTLNVNGGSTWYAYAVGKSGYTSYCPDPASPLTRVKATKAEILMFVSKPIAKSATPNLLANATVADKMAVPEFMVEHGVLLEVIPNGATEIEVPDTVVEIGEAAFVGCTEVERVILPETVQVIGEFAFFGCAALEELVLPTGELEVSDTAFLGCPGLADEDGMVVIDGVPFDCRNPLE